MAGGIDGLTVCYDIDDKFFQTIDGLVAHGQIQTTVRVEASTRTMFKLHIHSVGWVSVPCDRCLADMQIPIDTNDELSVKLGSEYSDEGEVVVIPETDGYIDTAQFIYEFVVLSLPLKRVHEPGQCDEATLRALNSHLASLEDDEDDDD